MSWETLVPVAVFLTITLGVWGFLSTMADRRPSSTEERLKRVLHPVMPQKDLKLLEQQQQAKFQVKVSVAASKLGKSLRPTNELELGKIRLHLLNAGYRGEQAVMAYYGWKLVGLLVALAIAVPVFITRYGVTQSGLTYSVLVGAVGFYLPDMYVGQIRKRRMEAIFLALPDALDLMVVCVEAGLGLDTAMRRVTSELSSSCPVLCEEFAIANFQVQMGRARKDVLRDLGTRTGVEDMRSLSAVVIQAEKFGSSIGGALRVQSDSMRLKRRQLAEERAAKTAVKIMIPLVLFIFPGVFVILVGPAGIQIAKTMLGKG
ncbi:tight adherence protein C [Singulisphaera sp. GP187]|uniref:type II secretion system F family protein n=1 Tax=Singulisphaera sp. GP187 TaxID=1882752 RepID=UPI0009294558|nr:type II secretion system F family protein [Singulisphaera sp. GP187]SIO62625.1 tight adherence protein C [Singulisphaera sp. GP187]